MTPRILVITPVQHIEGVPAILDSIGAVTYFEHPTLVQVSAVIRNFEAIFTNPNKSEVFISRELIESAPCLRVICTASTGTNHIDLAGAAEKGIAVLALTDAREVIGRISSTAEHAFGLMLSALRHIPQAFESVKRGEWDYTRFIGRQLDHLTVGVVGYGRLGSLFANYCRAFGCRVLVYDPYRQAAVPDGGIEQVELDRLVREADVISLHVHVAPETTGMVDRSWFSRMKPSVVLVNTARGEIINEADAVEFLRRNPSAWLAADVVADEVRRKNDSLLMEYARKHENVILTPHIGGMTIEGQQIAYRHAAQMLKRYFESVASGGTCGRQG